MMRHTAKKVLDRNRKNMEQAVLALSLLKFDSSPRIRVPSAHEILQLKKRLEYHKGILMKENALIQALAADTKTPYVQQSLKR